LEALAEPGAICVSRVVRDQVRDKLDFTFDDLGEQSVKTIARPVRVYRVRDRAVPIEQPLPASPQPLPLPDKPSVAVLPFANMSGDPEQEYFADGMVEESSLRSPASAGCSSSPVIRASPTRAKRST
jgi:adenylate cyclase